MDKKILNTRNMITWVKDNHSKFLSCNETLAEIAHLDSPDRIAGKTDASFDWEKNAGFIQKIDFKVYNGACNYINVKESLNTPNGTIDILVTKLQVVNHLGKCIGTSGFALDITDQPLIKACYYNEDSMNLGKAFGNEHLTRQEITVLKYILIGYTAKKIAQSLSISFRTVENYIATLKHKMQCKTKGDILMACVKHGLTYILHDAIGSIR